MKRSKLLILALALTGLAYTLTAQDGGNPPPGDLPPPHDGAPGGPDGRGRPGRMGRRLPPPPLLLALDANHDGIIDEQEIANAPAALKTLDKNGDGQLTPDELHPPMPPGGERGPGPGFRPPPREGQDGDQGQPRQPGQ